MRRAKRTPLSINQLMKEKFETMDEEQRAKLPRDFFGYQPQLYKELIMPSYIHGYSLAIEYMRKWFLNKFEKDYFKNINVNGRHVLDEWKHFNKQVIKREKPMLAIIPTMDFDHDREYRDAYMGDRRILLHKSDYQQSFFKDYKTMSFLYKHDRALKMNFTFRVRVGSRAEQVDLWNKMEIWFRIGATQHEYISADMHIPRELVLSLAEANGFKVENGQIVQLFDFISYMNQHSDLPIIFKMRAINQQPEFFVRIRDLYVHVACMDKLSLDDGEKEGKLDTNYHVELQATVTIPVPHFYVFFNQKPIQHYVHTIKDAIGIYSINSFEIPRENEKGWGYVLDTEYRAEVGDEYMDLHPIFDGPGNMCDVMRYTLKNFISPDSFIEIRVYHSNTDAILKKGKMDYKNLCFIYDTPIEEDETLIVAIYGDKEYINTTVSTIYNYKQNRIDSPKL